MEIKYKAWDKIQKRMWFNVQEAYNGLNRHCCEGKKYVVVQWLMIFYT